MFIAIIAALQSSIDSGINSTALMITRDIRGVLLRDTDPVRELRIGRALALLILLGAMALAPIVGQLGSIYAVLQSLLSLFQGPMLALLILGAFTRHATPAAGLITLVTGVAVAVALRGVGLNMLYVAFLSFTYALLALWIASYVTQRLSDATLDPLVYGRARAPD